MMRMKARESQHGAALVIGLILIVIASLGALNVMRSGHLQDRMASNMNNKVISQMAAESGAGLFVEWFQANGDSDLSAAWSNLTDFRILPENAQLPPFGYYWIPTEPNWQASPVKVTVVGLARQGNQTLAETRIGLEFVKENGSPEEIDGENEEQNLWSLGNLALPAPFTVGGRLSIARGGTNPALPDLMGFSYDKKQ